LIPPNRTVVINHSDQRSEIRTKFEASLHCQRAFTASEAKPKQKLTRNVPLHIAQLPYYLSTKCCHNVSKARKTAQTKPPEYCTSLFDWNVYLLLLPFPLPRFFLRLPPVFFGAGAGVGAGDAGGAGGASQSSIVTALGFPPRTLDE